MRREMNDAVVCAHAQCESWWKEWHEGCEYYDITFSEDPAVVCEAGKWPPDDADASRLMFASMLFEDAGRFDVAAKHFIAAARLDSAFVQFKSLLDDVKMRACAHAQEQDAAEIVALEMQKKRTLWLQLKNQRHECVEKRSS